MNTSSLFQLRELYTSYIQEAFSDEISLIGSGIVANNVQISGIAAGEGYAGTIRYFGNVNATINNQDETSTDATISQIATGTMQAIKIARDTAWSEFDITSVLTNERGLVEAARQAAFARAKDEQTNLIDIMFGLLEDNSDNDSGDAINVIAKTATGAATAANQVSRAAVVNTIVQLEGNPQDFIMVMNWAAYGDLANLDETSLIRTSDNPLFSGSFMGVNTLVNNQVADITSTGTSFLNGSATAHFDNSKVQRVIYFVRKSSFAYAPIAMPTPVGVQRDELVGSGAGSTDVVYRWGHVLHAVGTDYVGITTAYATNALLKAGASWDRKWDGIKTQAVAALVYNG